MIFLYYTFATGQYQRMHSVYGSLSAGFVRSARRILVPRYRMSASNNFVKTEREYSRAPTDDLIRF